MKKYSKLALVCAVLLLTAALLAACSGGGSDSPAGGQKVITDQLGREVVIPETINKVAGTHVYGGKMLFAMGQKDKLGFQMQLGADLEALAKVDAAYGALPTALSSPNGTDSPEAMVSLGVNLVFTDAFRGEEEANIFTNAGIATVAVSGETFEEVYQTAEIMGEIFDCPERAVELKEFIENMRTMVAGRVANLSDEEKPVVLISGSGGVYTAATADMFQHQMVETAGGINAGADLTGRWAKISAEDIINLDPDYIVLGSSFGADTVESVLADPALQSVSAIRNKNVYIFPSTLGWWDFPLPQSILGIVWTAKTIHPELFEDINIKDTADSVYKFIYGYTYTELGGTL